MSEWLYQIRIKVSENISNDLRDMCQLNLSKRIETNSKKSSNGTCLYL